MKEWWKRLTCRHRMEWAWPYDYGFAVYRCAKGCGHSEVKEVNYG